MRHTISEKPCAGPCPRSRLRRLLAAWMLLATPGIASSAAALELDRVEHVLDGAVRLEWSDLGTAEEVQIKRGPAGGTMEWIGWVQRDEEPVFVDRGPAGAGLPPGEWEYWIRGRYPTRLAVYSGSWVKQVFVMPEQCAPQPPTPSNLPTVPLVDRDGDGLHTGADVALALQICGAAGGCVAEALPVTYDDVEIFFGKPSDCPASSWCNTWDFPLGLVIQGHGSASVFRSPVYGPGDYEPRPVFRIDAPLQDVRFRNFTVDGRKREQPDPGSHSSIWQHNGIDVVRTEEERARDGCVHNVTVHDVMKQGIALLGADDWIIEYNTVYDIGCNTDRSPCDMLTSATPPARPFRPDTQALGFGINVVDKTRGSVVRHNRIDRAVKMGIQFKTYTGDWPDPPTAGQQAAMVTDFLAHDNHVSGSMGAGIAVNGGIQGRIEGNLVELTTDPGETELNTGMGFVCGNWVDGITVFDNEFRWNGQEGLAIGCTGGNVFVQGNLIEDNCLDTGAGQADLKVGVSVPSGLAVVTGNTIRTQACEASASLRGGYVPTVLGGESYTTGPLTTIGVQVTGGVGLLLASLDLANGGTPGTTGIDFHKKVEHAIVFDGVLASSFDGFLQPIVNASEGAVLCEEVTDPAEREATGCSLGDPP